MTANPHLSTTAYSVTPLAKKLGIKSGYTIRIINEPSHYFTLFADWPADVIPSETKKEPKHLIHLFATELRTIKKEIPLLKKEITQNGIIWISWPKKASKVITDITEDLIREIALANGLVDVKVCAVDEIWSGLKLVIPVKDRK